MLEISANPYAVSQGSMPSHRAVSRTRSSLFRLMQLFIFQCTFMAFVLYPSAGQGLRGVVKELRSLFDQWGQTPVQGFVLFFFGPAILYLVVRSITLERYFKESWFRFCLMGAIAFQAYFILGSAILKFAALHFGIEAWSFWTARMVVSLACVSVTLASEFVLANAGVLALKAVFGIKRKLATNKA